MARIDGFDATQVDPNVGFQPIPEGDYLATIVESSSEKTKKGDGEMYKLKFEIIDGEYKGRTLFTYLVVKHPNQTTVNIARGNLSAICHAVGVMKPADTVELHNIPLLISVKVKPREDKPGELSNDITGFKSRDKANVKPTATTTATGGANDWMKRPK